MGNKFGRLFVVRFLFLGAVVCFLPAESSALNYYVSQNGAGLKDGSSYKNSWAGFSHVKWGIGQGKVGPGDTLYVCGEIRETLRIPLSGTHDNPITISGEYQGARGVVNGAEIMGGWVQVQNNIIKIPCNWFPRIIVEKDKPLNFLKWDMSEQFMVKTLKDRGPGTWTFDEHGKYVYAIPFDSANPIIEIAKRETYQALIYALGVSYIVIKDLSVKNSNGSGIKISAQSSHIVVKNNKIFNIAEWGLLAERSQDIVVNDNEIYNTCLKYPTGGEGLRIYQSKGGQVFNNRVHDINNVGIDLTAGTTEFRVYNNSVYNLTAQGSLDGIYSDNAQENFYYDNFVYNIPNGAGIALASETPGQASRANYVYNNIIKNAKAGILLGGSYGSNETRSTGNYIYHNTVYDCGIWSEIFIGDSSNNETIKNNIFYRKGPGSVLTANGIIGHDIDYNIYYRADGYKYIFTWDKKVFNLPGYQTYSNMDKNSLNIDPKISGNYLKLEGSSPAIDRGITLDKVKDDFNGISRPQGRTSDIGSYERIIIGGEN